MKKGKKTNKIFYFFLLFIIVNICGTMISLAEIGNITENDHFKRINQNDQNIITSDDIVPGETNTESNSALRQGTYTIVNTGNTEEISTFLPEKSQRSTSIGAYDETIKYIKNIVNYILGFLGIIALIYFIYHGYTYIFGIQEEAIKDAGKKMKTAGIAIGGIALSWFVVSFIIYAIRLIVN